MLDPQLAVLVASFLVLLVMGVPIAVAIGISALLAIASLGDVPPCYVVAQRMSSGVASFPLLAIPFFVLAGNLMGAGGMARRLVDFASAVVGHVPAGLSYVTTLTCMLFGAISGSATAAVSSIGGMMIPEMRRKGFDRDFSVAVTTTAATTGLVIPPSNIMIVFAVVAGNVSVAAMFMAGVLPGIAVGLAIGFVCWLFRAQHAAAPDEGVEARRLLRSAFLALPSLFLVVLVLAGILGGAFSATEAAAIAVAYAFFFAVVVYREVRLVDLPQICLRTGITTGVIFLLIGTSQAMSWVLAYQRIPQTVSESLLRLTDQPWAILLVINAILLFVGTFMDMTPAVLIFAPIFLPVTEAIGIDPVHFGIIMIVNLCIGLCTPPVGTCLFVGCGVGRTSLANVTGPMIPFLIAMVGTLLLITYVPALSLWLPGLLQAARSR
jgi:tripartite ATP-independent transporter DctM subunit